MQWVLDSSSFIEIGRNTETGQNIIKMIGEEPIVLSSITVYEILRGLKPHEEVIVGHLNNADIINFDENSAKESANIEKTLAKKGTMINRLDILIAGSCMANNMGMITIDKDFLRIDGLKVKLV